LAEFERLIIWTDLYIKKNGVFVKTELFIKLTF
jgi:hypothetical protein